MHTGLIENMNRFVSVDEHEAHLLNRYTTSHVFQKKESILSGGQVCRSLYFVEKGCLRMFFLDAKSKEQITQFAIDGWWLTDLISFMDQEPSEYYIQTIETSEVISIDSHVYDDLLKELPQLERYFRIIFQRNLAAAQRRAKYLYEMSKEEFFHHFITSFPEFVQRVPQYMVASYLGLTPEYASELRKKSSSKRS